MSDYSPPKQDVVERVREIMKSDVIGEPYWTAIAEYEPDEGWFFAVIGAECEAFECRLGPKATQGAVDEHKRRFEALAELLNLAGKL